MVSAGQQLLSAGLGLGCLFGCTPAETGVESLTSDIGQEAETTIPNWVENNPCNDVVGTNATCELDGSDIDTGSTIYNYPGGITSNDWAGASDVIMVAGGKITLEGIGEGWQVYSANSGINVSGNTSTSNEFTSCGTLDGKDYNESFATFGFLATNGIISTSTVNAVGNISVAQASSGGSDESTFTSAGSVDIGREIGSNITTRSDDTEAVEDVCGQKRNEYLPHLDANVSLLANGLKRGTTVPDIDLIMVAETTTTVGR